MKWITTNHVLPIIKEKFNTAFIEHRTLLTYGIGESMLAEMIKDWEEKRREELISGEKNEEKIIFFKE